MKKIRYIISMLFLLFSLSPCSVKEALFHSVNADYAKPLNKSKTIAPTSTCSYSSTKKLQFSVAKKSSINKKNEPVYFLDKPFFRILSTKVYNKYSKISSGNSPPIYILYKRLKIDLA